jgi:hypothetical protein
MPFAFGCSRTGESGNSFRTTLAPDHVLQEPRNAAKGIDTTELKIRLWTHSQGGRNETSVFDKSMGLGSWARGALEAGALAGDACFRFEFQHDTAESNFRASLLRFGRKHFSQECSAIKHSRGRQITRTLLLLDERLEFAFK